MKLGNVEGKQPSEMRQDNGLAIVIMGPSGSGKTTRLKTLFDSKDRSPNLPYYGPVAVLDVDGKAHVLSDHPDLDIFPTYDWKTFDTTLQEFEKQSLHSYWRSLCIDGLSLLQINSQKGSGVFDVENPQLRMSKYGSANILMVNLAQRVRVLTERGINVILNVWSIPEMQEDSIVRIIPDITPTLLNRFLGQFDHVFLLEKNRPPNKPFPPVLRTGGPDRYMIRSATSPDSPLRDIPETIVDPSYTKILDLFHGIKE